MNGEAYFALAFLITTLMLWGYAHLLWMESRALNKRTPPDETF